MLQLLQQQISLNQSGDHAEYCSPLACKFLSLCVCVCVLFSMRSGTQLTAKLIVCTVTLEYTHSLTHWKTNQMRRVICVNFSVEISAFQLSYYFPFPPCSRQLARDHPSSHFNGCKVDRSSLTCSSPLFHHESPVYILSQTLDTHLVAGDTNCWKILL